MLKNIKKMGKGSFMALLVLLVAGAVIPVRAQSATIVSLTPQNNVVEQGRQMTLELEIAAGVNVNAYDVNIRYDSTVLRLDSWEHGDFLSKLATVNQVNEPGFFQLVCTQIAQPGANGDGTLLKLVFTGVGVGSSAVSIEEIELALTVGETIFPQLKNASVDVLPQTAYPAATSTPVAPPTAVPSAIPTRTPTVPSASEPTDVPVEEEPTLTAVVKTAQSSLTPPVSSEQPAPEASDAALSLSEGSTPAAPGGETDPPDPGSEESASPEQTVQNQREARLNGLLAAILIISALALLAMLWILFKRRNTQEDDLLL